MSAHRDDREVLALRAAWDGALGSAELREQRAEVQRLYSEACDADRRAGATARHYGGMNDPRGLGRPEARIVEADECARECWAAWQRADSAYRAAREAVLRAAGLVGDDGQEIRIGQTAEERRGDEAYRLMRRDYPPEGWGRSSPTAEERIARWRARPKWERIADSSPRIAEGLAFRAAYERGEA